MKVLIGLLTAGLLAAATVVYQYDGSGRLISATYDNGIVVTYTYDAAGNLLSRSVSGAAQPQESKPAGARRGADDQPRKTSATGAPPV